MRRSPSLAVLEVTSHEIVLWKPPGLSCELPRDPGADSVTARLRNDGFDNLRLVHRLDRPASGLMVVARSAEAAAYYAAEIAARRWRKLYVAQVARAGGECQALVGRHKAYLSVEGRRALVVRSGGKPSLLTVLHAEPVPGVNGRTHVLVELHTGRFHQIRVMLAALHAPLVGDTLYGGPGGETMYLEHVLLAARPFGSAKTRVWRSPMYEGRPSWSAGLIAALEAEAATMVNEL